MDVDGLKQCGHFGQSFGTAHGGAGSEDLSAVAVILPPEHDPVPASCGFALLKTTALETPAAWRGGRVSPFIFRHGRTIPSETARSLICGSAWPLQEHTSTPRRRSGSDG